MKKTKRAMISVEAALVLPVFIFVIYFFLYFYQILMVQEVLHVNATNTVEEISSYGTVANLMMKEAAKEKINDFSGLSKDSEEGIFSDVISDIDLDAVSDTVIDSIYLSNRMAPYIENKVIIKRCIDGGYDGISFNGSSLFDDEECVNITMEYRIGFPIFQHVLPKIPVIQTVRMRSFNGYAVAAKIEMSKEDKQEKGEEQMVYITENGSVYHTNKMCTSLKISISPCPSSMIIDMRNHDGAKYYPCERCFHKGDDLPSTVYITAYGNRYHKNSSCTAIDRTILTVPISEVSDRRLCKRCQQYH